MAKKKKPDPDQEIDQENGNGSDQETDQGSEGVTIQGNAETQSIPLAKDESN